MALITNFQVTIIPGKLVFLIRKSAEVPEDTEELSFFNTDDLYHYQPFFNDFGPLNLNHLVLFCRLLDQRFKDDSKRVQCYWTSSDPERKANCCYLLGSYLILRRGKSADEAFLPFKRLAPSLKPFRDAALGPVTFPLRLHDVLRSIYKAFQDKLLDVDSFDVDKYHHYEQVENGDLNWIVPRKIIGFAGPAGTRPPFEIYPWTPEDFIELFKSWNVTCVIRLNKRTYDSKRFTKHGIKHHDIVFPDGTPPSLTAVKRFLAIIEHESGAIAVHCKAGLGRTGTLICCYLIRKYRWTAIEAIAWTRICRPGSVVGPQQHFLQRFHSILAIGDLPTDLNIVGYPSQEDEEQELIEEGLKEPPTYLSIEEENQEREEEEQAATSQSQEQQQEEEIEQKEEEEEEPKLINQQSFVTTPMHHYNLRPRAVAVVPSGRSLQMKKLEQQHKDKQDLTEKQSVNSDRPSTAPGEARSRNKLKLSGSGTVVLPRAAAAASTTTRNRRMSVTLPVDCVDSEIVPSHYLLRSNQPKEQHTNK